MTSPTSQNSQQVFENLLDSSEEVEPKIDILVNENSEPSRKVIIKKKKVKSKQLLDFKDIASIIWNAQCELRNKEGITGINAMHHINLVLLIRTLNKQNCKKLGIPEELSFENIKDLNEKDLFEKIYNTSNNSNCLLRYIRQNERFGFNKDIPFEIKNESTLHYLIVKVQEIDTKYFFEKTDLIGDIYESFINREGKTMKDLGQYFTDRQLIDYLVKLCDPKVIDGKIETIYDGASGTGGFLTQAINYLNTRNETINWEINKHNIYGSDINRNTFALLKLNMYFTTGQIIDNLVMKDTLVNDSLKVDGYDNILMNPPFGIKGIKYTDMNSKIKALGINGTKGEILFLQNCMANLAKEGRCVIVVPDGVLFNSTKMYKETRNYLMDKFELEKVIKVGNGEFFKNTGVKTAVLFFKNTGESTKNVEFVQVNKVGNKIEEIPLMDVSIDKIKENDYSLNMNMYKEVVFGNCENYEMVKISDLIPDFNSGKYIPNTSGSLYPYYNSNGIIGYMDTYMFEGEYIVQATSGSGINDNTFYYNGRFNATNFTTIFSTLDNCLVKYLYYFIRIKLNLKEQCCNGSTIPNLDKKSFCKIKIPLPSLEIQQRIVEQLDNIYENEIENSKKTIEGLEKSIESIMKNTLMRKDLEDYKISDIFEINKGNIQTSKIDTNNGEYPIISKGKDNKHWKYIDTYTIDGENIFIATEYAGDGTGLLPINYYDGKCNISCLCYHLNNKTINKTRFIYLYLKSINKIFDSRFQKGSCKKTLDLQIFNKFKINVPPLEIQEQIVAECNSKETIINLLKDNIIKAEKQANEIMDNLFK